MGRRKKSHQRRKRGSVHCSVHWTSIRAYVPRNDRLHYLRLIGADTERFEKNKFQERQGREVRRGERKERRDAEEGEKNGENDGQEGEKNGEETPAAENVDEPEK